MRKYRVALVGYYGFGNLGDELLLEASINALERCGLDRARDLVVLSNKPDETAEKLNIPSVSRWKLRDVYKILRESETLLLGGGGLFQDSTSLRSCVWYWGLVKLARMCGAKPWALGQSIGPLHRQAARWLTRNALKSCDVLQVRDHTSLELAQKLGLKHCQLGADLALTLALDRDLDTAITTCETATRTPNAHEYNILVNLRPLPGADGDAMLEKFIDAAAEFCKNFNSSIIGVALSPGDKNLLERVNTNGKIKFSRIVLLRTLKDINATWYVASAAIGMRLHFAILSALFKTPLAVLPYDPKVTAFAQWVGLNQSLEDQDAPDNKNIAPVMPVMPVELENIQAEIDALCRHALT